MKITIKYEAIEKLEGSKNVKDASKVIVLQDDVELAMHGYFLIAEDKYHYCDIYGYSLEVASSEAEFNQYLLDEVLV